MGAKYGSRVGRDDQSGMLGRTRYASCFTALLDVSTPGVIERRKGSLFDWLGVKFWRGIGRRGSMVCCGSRECDPE